MNETLADFISRRMAEIDELEAPLRAQLDKFASERSQLARAAHAAGINFGSLNVTLDDAYCTATARRRRASTGSIKSAVVAILKEAGRGMQTQEILKAINERLGTNYPRSSLSPQLSRLKADYQITHDGTSWAINELFS